MDTTEDDVGFKFVKQLALDLDRGNLKLPTFPDVALRVRRVLNDPHSNIDKVLGVVKADPVLTARLLKMANSALMRRGVDGPVDLRTAIGRLGFDMVRNAAMAVALQQIMTARAMGPLGKKLSTLWHHSLQVAVMSFVLAKQSKNILSEQAMLAGLLHDIGKYYVYMRADQHPELFATESDLERIVEEWHGDIGAAIMEAWGFEKAYVAAALEHDNYSREHPGDDADTLDIVMLANLHANVGKPQNPKQWDWIPALKKLKLTPETSIKLICESRDEIKSILSSLT